MRTDLKVDGNAKLGGVGIETVIQLLYGTVMIEGYLQYERFVFVLEISIRFRLLQLYLLAMSRQILPLRSALPIQDVKIHTYCTIRSKSIGGKITSATIYWRNHSLFLEFADFLGGSSHVAYSKSQLDAPIYLRCKS